MTNTNREEWEQELALVIHAESTWCEFELPGGEPSHCTGRCREIAEHVAPHVATLIENQGREIADLKTQPEMLLTYWREEVADYPLNTAAAQRLRLCIAELEGVLQSPTQAPLQEGATT